jgi:hypothetical protein
MIRSQPDRRGRLVSSVSSSSVSSVVSCIRARRWRRLLRLPGRLRLLESVPLCPPVAAGRASISGHGTRAKLVERGSAVPSLEIREPSRTRAPERSSRRSADVASGSGVRALPVTSRCYSTDPR